MLLSEQIMSCEIFIVGGQCYPEARRLLSESDIRIATELQSPCRRVLGIHRDIRIDGAVFLLR